MIFRGLALRRAGRWIGVAAFFFVLAACAGQNRPPILVSAAPLDYPTTARETGVEGVVTLEYNITASGQVENVRVVRAEPPGVFDAAAIAAVSAWRFTPAIEDGEPVLSMNRVSTLTFQLGETDEYNRD